jgi:hypothetical protein
MGPRHGTDDGREPLQQWDDWIEREIREAMERGEFADLPGQGKPIRIETNPFDPSMDMAHSRLKNAGYAPVWMELDREITAMRTELDAFMDRSAAYLGDLRARLETVSAPASADRQPELDGRWRAFWRRLWAWLNVAADGSTGAADDAVTRVDLFRVRERMRVQYLERAAALDKKIGDYHAALPRALWHLQRPGMPRERAERAFDARIPPPVS